MHDWSGKTVAPDHLTDEQRELLGGGMPARSNLWGSQFSLPPNVAAAPNPTQLQPYIDVGPLEEPIEFLLGGFIPTGSIAALFEARLDIGVGRASYTEIIPNSGFLNRVIVAQQLRVSIRRTDALAGNVSLNAWCSIRRAGITAGEQLAPLPGLPTVFSSEVAVFAAATPAFTLTIPATTTAIQTARQLTTTDLELEQTVGGILFFSETLLAATFDQVIVSLDPKATVSRLVRAPFVLAANALVKYLH